MADSQDRLSPTDKPCDTLKRIALQMVSSLDLHIVLATITQGLVDELDGAFARIGEIRVGDAVETGPGDHECEAFHAKRVAPDRGTL